MAARASAAAAAQQFSQRLRAARKAMGEQETVSHASTVGISLAEMKVLVDIADERATRNRQAGVRDGIRTHVLSPREIEVQGIVAEYAAMVMTGADIEPLFDTTPRTARTDKGADLRVPGTQQTVDVKSAYVRGCITTDKERRQRGSRPLGIYAFPNKKAFPADYYTLVCLSIPNLPQGQSHTHSFLQDAFTVARAAPADDPSHWDLPKIVAIAAGHVSAEEIFSVDAYSAKHQSYYMNADTLHAGLPG